MLLLVIVLVGTISVYELFGIHGYCVNSRLSEVLSADIPDSEVFKSYATKGVKDNKSSRITHKDVDYGEDVPYVDNIQGNVGKGHTDMESNILNVSFDDIINKDKK